MHPFISLLWEFSHTWLIDDSWIALFISVLKQTFFILYYSILFLYSKGSIIKSEFSTAKICITHNPHNQKLWMIANLLDMRAIAWFWLFDVKIHFSFFDWLMRNISYLLKKFIFVRFFANQNPILWTGEFLDEMEEILFIFSHDMYTLWVVDGMDQWMEAKVRKLE